MRSPRTSFPLTRLDCRSIPRPCPYVSCTHNNYLTVSPAGYVRVSHPDLEPDEVPPDESCCLDVASEGPQTLERVGIVLGITRERVRQIEISIVAKVRAALNAAPDQNPKSRGKRGKK